jgi:enoyl-CoA hydratase/carnithine racemase
MVKLVSFINNSYFLSHRWLRFSRTLCVSPVLSIRDSFRRIGCGSIELHTKKNCPLAYVTIANGKRRNALSGKMMAEFSAIVDELENWDGTAVILCGLYSTFCSGADLSLAREHFLGSGMGKDMCTLMQDATSRFLNLDIVSVAAIEGSAVGGGAELATVS